MDSPQADVDAQADELDALRKDVLDLARHTLDALMHDLKFGSVTQRNTAIRIVSPHLMRMLNATGEEDQLGALKESITNLMAEVRGAPEPT